MYLILLVMLFGSSQAMAQAWPVRSIRFVAPFPPDSGTGLDARMPGTALIAKSLPDGYKGGATAMAAPTRFVLLPEVSTVPQVTQKLLEMGLVAGINTPEQYARVIQAETVKWAKVVKDTSIKIE